MPPQRGCDIIAVFRVSSQSLGSTYCIRESCGPRLPMRFHFFQGQRDRLSCNLQLAVYIRSGLEASGEEKKKVSVLTPEFFQLTSAEQNPKESQRYHQILANKSPWPAPQSGCFDCARMSLVKICQTSVDTGKKLRTKRRMILKILVDPILQLDDFSHR